MIAKLGHKLLMKIDAERAHDFAVWAMKHRLLAPGRFATSESKTKLFGFEIDNPLGLAAGFDKNGELVDSIREYGFGWDEVGSITYLGGEGNPKPRIFRLDEESLLNRMGLNGKPAYQIVERLKKAKTPFAVNIAKTHSPDILGDSAICDIVSTYKLVINELEPLEKLIYVTINLSCPNTQEGKTFENPESLGELLSEVRKIGGRTPKLVKFSPNLWGSNLDEIIKIADSFVQGYVCGNTLSFAHDVYGKGGGSGGMLRSVTPLLLVSIRKRTDKVIIGCGGIDSGVQASAYESYGADVCQAYTGFVRGIHSGVRFAHDVNECWMDMRTKTPKRRENVRG